MLFEINKKQNSAVELSNDNRLYTIVGQHDFLDEDGYPRLNLKDDVKPLAELSITNGKTVYFVKRSDSGRLFNPIGLYSEGQEEKFMKHRGKNQWSLRRCNHSVFKNYINFLKTKNEAWFRNAEREI